MHLSGVLDKMGSIWDESTHEVTYFILLNEDLIFLKELLGRKIHLKHMGYQCFSCGKNRKIKGMGYCHVCYVKVPQTNPSVYHPELSKAHLGIAEKDLEYEKKLQLQPHVVYLADTGELKVGVTRKSQIPTRWIDQGALHAIPLVETENRYEAGIIEVELSKKISDKTQFKKMLLTHRPMIHMNYWVQQYQSELINNHQNAKWIEPTDYYFKYPHLEDYPSNIESVNFIKNHEFSGRLVGIKGQYWVLDNGLAFNVRSHQGFVVELTF